MYPNDRRYTRDHEWAKQEDGGVRIGITAFAASRLSDVVYIELPKVGAQIRAAEPFGVIESVKAASDLYAPITGRVVEVNDRLVASPEVVNQDPHGEAWMIVVEPANDAEWDNLLEASAYEELVGVEGA